MILALITVGKMLEARSKGKTTDALKGLMKLAPKTAVIIREVYTGRTQDRPKWINLQPLLKPGDKIVFDSVSRMARNSEEGFEEYQKLFGKKVNLEFLQERHINTEVYRNALKISIPKTGTNIDVILEAVEQYLMLLAKEQIKIAFDQAQKEVDDLRQRTREGIETARLNGKILGRPKGQRSITEKEIRTCLLYTSPSPRDTR